MRLPGENGTFMRGLFVSLEHIGMWKHSLTPLRYFDGNHQLKFVAMLVAGQSEVRISLIHVVEGGVDCNVTILVLVGRDCSKSF